MTSSESHSPFQPLYTKTAAKYPVAGRFRMMIAEHRWTRQNGPTIALQLPPGTADAATVYDRRFQTGRGINDPGCVRDCPNLHRVCV